ncbi:glyoxalase/bleomycin resistance protein/dioxygenase [Cutaneotrichosporon oleaginosum]|uniref:Glyoxalase/bleomycin resistance protein/dioxygenase n=1 Tax=Cutaneotrichosporon oleaginosum TaxID=879819 RepID=A0A0J0XRJ1_9TREE|nr:glyoxalase/bleomycin resistance protein/dioxygenase [Cutaneotrichosporon oleaginosum]KLT43751.1 glyoxalase/bleomycin resistance protein/dioxygenase [Cutaneotrichosporon oleaginosum]TXT05168.1 hypothetical protein COLE_06488 [Cutaneotrichosporon oleaginosum]
MLDHIGISVSDYARSKAFYEPVLATLGSSMQMEPAPHVSGWGPSPMEPSFWISAGCATQDKPPIGPVHVAFTAKTRKAVDAFYEAAIKAGAKCNGKPGIRAEYHPNYYGAFVHDLDGHNIEAVCHMPE